jgi:hypothetical protein
MQSCTNTTKVHPRPLKISTDLSIRVFLEYNIKTIRLSGLFAIEEHTINMQWMLLGSYLYLSVQ